MNEHVPGTKLAERLLTRPQGATMAEIIARDGGPQYNVLKIARSAWLPHSQGQEGAGNRGISPSRRPHCPSKPR